MIIEQRMLIQNRKNGNPHMPNRTALNMQVDGNHYKDYAIQPIQYCMANNLNACQSNIVKYITRYKDKNGVKDLLKIKHYVDLILQLEYGIVNPDTDIECV